MPENTVANLSAFMVRDRLSASGVRTPALCVQGAQSGPQDGVWDPETDQGDERTNR